MDPNSVGNLPMDRKSIQIVLHCFLFILSLKGIQGAAYAQQQHISQPLSITSAKAVHDLAPALIPNARVHITGTITYYDPSELILFIQDKTGGVFVNVDHVYPFRPGQRIFADGGAKLGYRTGVSPASKLRVVGDGDTVPPKEVDYALLSSGRMDCQLISFTGTVRDAVIEHHPESHSNTLHMDLTLDGGEAEVYVKQFAHLDPVNLIGSKLKLVGVAGGAFDAQQQLGGVVIYVADEKGIQVLEKSPEPLNGLPVASIDDAFSTMRNKDMSPRLHIRGTLTYYANGESAVLEHQGKAIFVQTRETRLIPIGQVVDAYGFADNHNYSPMLRNTVLLPTGKRDEVTPISVRYEDAISGLYSDRLISIEGTLISQIHSAGSETLTIEAAGHVVRVLLRNVDNMPALSLNSRLRLTGICRVITGGPWREPIMFNIAMRSPEDIALVDRAPWWSVRHLAYLLGILLFSALLVVLWTLFLRKRISEQSRRIERSMAISKIRGEVLEQISCNASVGELFQSLAQAVESLLPSASCAFSWGEIRRDALAETDLKIFDTSLMKGTEASGRFSVFTQFLSEDDEDSEVIVMLRELLTLASRHAELHDSLVHFSTHDPLTNLANRRLCESRIAEALSHASVFSIVYVDIDKFKLVNDKYGHSVGDLYLKAISARLSEELRPSDTLARVGGDEFVAVMPMIGAMEAEVLADRLQKCFSGPFDLEGVCLYGTASFGIACFPDHGKTRQELERYADSAMYLAKQARQEPKVISSAMMSLSDISLALRDNQFRLSYQPQFSAEGRLTGLEALIRLEDPILGTVMPDSFIPAAEASNMIVELGDWVIRTAIADAVRWGLAQGGSIIVAVNVAARQLEQPNFAARVLSYLSEKSMPARLFEIELVERALLSENREILRQLCLLSDAGVRISLDDFGTNCSALSLLHRLPVDTIKIDRSFVVAISSEARVLAVIEAIFAMAQSLALRVVAEGVETSDEMATLLTIGEMDFQGYLFSRPVSSVHIEAMLHRWRNGIELAEGAGGDRVCEDATHSQYL